MRPLGRAVAVCSVRATGDASVSAAGFGAGPDCTGAALEDEALAMSAGVRTAVTRPPSAARRVIWPPAGDETGLGFSGIVDSGRHGDPYGRYYKAHRWVPSNKKAGRSCGMTAPPDTI